MADALVEAALYAVEVVTASTLSAGAHALWQLCWTRQDQFLRLVILSTRFKTGGSGYRLLEFMQGHHCLRPS